MADNEQKGVDATPITWLRVERNFELVSWEATWGKGSVYVSNFPGCCGIAIVYKLSILPREESVADGVRRLYEIAEKAFHTFNVGMLMATHNTLQTTNCLREMFARAGWTESTPFHNPNSRNDVIVFTLTRKTFRGLLHEKENRLSDGGRRATTCEGSIMNCKVCIISAGMGIGAFLWLVIQIFG